MKIRQTFVTNSSSSSYTLIVNNDKPKGTYNLVDLIMMYQVGSKLTEIAPDGTMKFSEQPEKQYFESWTIDDYIRNTEFRIQCDREALEKQEKELEKLQSILEADDNVILMVSKYVTIEEAKEDIEWQVLKKATKINDLKKQLAKWKDNCRTLKEYKGREGDWIVVFTDIDHWGDAKILKAIEDTGAVVIKKEVR